MTDTPLHEHPAVLHLMGTEHWPKQGAARLIYDDTRSGARWWWYVDEHNAVDPVGIKTAHSLITLAAVRGMWDEGYDVNCNKETGRYRVLFGDESPRWFDTALAAYQATVMGKESSK